MWMALRNFVLMAVLACAPVFLLAQLDNAAAPTDLALQRIVCAVPGVDYLFVGSSFTYSGINPLLFTERGLKAYNLGTPCAGVSYYHLLANDYVARTGTRPRTLLIEVTPVSFATGADDWKRYTIHRTLVEPRSHEEVALKYGLGTRYFELVRKSSVQGAQALARLARGQTRPECKKVLSTLGMVVSNTQDAPDGRRDEAKFKETLLDTYPPQKAEELITLAKSHRDGGERVVFHQPPIFARSLYFTPEFMAEYEEMLERLTKAGFEVIPPDDVARYSPADRRNGDHLNSEGAEKYTEYLMGKLGIEIKR